MAPRSGGALLCALLCACQAVAAFFVPPLPRVARLPGKALGDARRLALPLACSCAGGKDRAQVRVQQGRISTRKMNVEQLQARCPHVCTWFCACAALRACTAAGLRCMAHMQLG